MPAQRDRDMTLRDFLSEKGAKIFGEGEAVVLDQLRKRGFHTLVEMTETRVKLTDGSNATIEMQKTPEGTCFVCSQLPAAVRNGISNVLETGYFREAFGGDEATHPTVIYK